MKTFLTHFEKASKKYIKRTPKKSGKGFDYTYADDMNKKTKTSGNYSVMQEGKDFVITPNLTTTGGINTYKEIRIPKGTVVLQGGGKKIKIEQAVKNPEYLKDVYQYHFKQDEIKQKKDKIYNFVASMELEIKSNPSAKDEIINDYLQEMKNQIKEWM